MGRLADQSHAVADQKVLKLMAPQSSPIWTYQVPGTKLGVNHVKIINT